jgi:methylthioribose-1-phosphate isomerase
MNEPKMDPTTPLRYDSGRDELVLLDQTRLPGEVVHLRLRSPEQVFEAIRSLRVRGAPAIGIAAAYGAVLAAGMERTDDPRAVRERVSDACAYLAKSRPTAVNLFWALDRMAACVARYAGESGEGLKMRLRAEAGAILHEDEENCRRIGENGLSLLSPGMGLLTHCNAGSLATSRYGTALAPIHIGQSRGYAFRVYADETRPLLQGARLTAFELMQDGVDTTLLCEGMAASVLSAGLVQAVLVGADRIAANGDAANKVGTNGLSILAKHYGVPFYVCAPLSTFDAACPSGGAIPIEYRGATEVTEMHYRSRMAPEGVKVYNPAFDVTEADRISAIVTERGVLRPPYGPAIARLFDGKEA